MRPIIISGETTEEKFKSLENILGKILRRSRKHTVTIMPSIPLFFSAKSVPADGIIFDWLFPTDGVITKVCLAVGHYETQDPVKFTASINGIKGGQYKSFETKKRVVVDELNLPVTAGDRLTFRVPDETQRESVSGIWVSFLFQMGIRDSKKETFIIEELERLIEGDFKEVENG